MSIESEFESSELKLANQILSNLGYFAEKLTNTGRYFYGVVKTSDQNKAFFKFALNPEISAKLGAQIMWSEHFNTQQALVGLTFRSPNVLASGVSGAHQYGLFEFIDSPALAVGRAQNYAPDIGLLEAELDQVVELNQAIMALPEIELPTTQDVNSPHETRQIAIERYLKVNVSWYDERVRSEYDLDDLLQILNDFHDNFEFASNHGDFVPWHILKSNTGLILIDAENASFQKPKYYDFCYFFHRVWTKLERPDIAMEYLNKFLKSLPETEKDDFYAKFKTLLASRIIGGFFDAYNDLVVDKSFHESLLRQYRAGQIV